MHCFWRNMNLYLARTLLREGKVKWAVAFLWMNKREEQYKYIWCSQLIHKSSLNTETTSTDTISSKMDWNQWEVKDCPDWNRFLRILHILQSRQTACNLFRSLAAARAEIVLDGILVLCQKMFSTVRVVAFEAEINILRVTRGAIHTVWLVAVFVFTTYKWHAVNTAALVAMTIIAPIYFKRKK